MSCTRRGFLKTIGAAMVGLGVTRLEPLRAFASSSVGSTGTAELGGPASGPYSIAALRQRAVDAALYIGDRDLADELGDVCCWAPAAAAIRQRPIDLQSKGAQFFFQDFPGGDQLARTFTLANNTAWRRPQFSIDPDTVVARHVEQLPGSPLALTSAPRTRVVTPQTLNGRGQSAQLGLILDRETGDRLARAASDRAEPMWAALSIFSGIMLDPTDDLSRRLKPALSLTRAHDRALARSAAIRYTQIIIGAVQRAIWSDHLGGANPALPLVELSAGGYLPLGEEDGDFLLLNVGASRAVGYRSAHA